MSRSPPRNDSDRRGRKSSSKCSSLSIGKSFPSPDGKMSHYLHDIPACRLYPLPVYHRCLRIAYRHIVDKTVMGTQECNLTSLEKIMMMTATVITAIRITIIAIICTRYRLPGSLRTVKKNSARRASIDRDSAAGESAHSQSSGKPYPRKETAPSSYPCRR